MTTDATREHCIDAELMAAWADGGLPAADAERVELHLSNCERCQEVLAAFMRSQPAAAVVLPFWVRPVVRWSAAGLAAAAAVVLMVWTGQPPSPGQPETTMASRQAVPAPPPPPAPDAAGQAAAGVPKDEAPARAIEVPPLPPVPSLPPVSPASPPPPAPVFGATVAKPIGNAANAAAVADSAREEKVAGESPAEIVIVAPDPQEMAAMRQTAAVGRGGGRGGAVAGASGGLASRGSPGPARWRVLAGAKVERSLDGGVTWTTATVAPGPPVIITAGSAASQQVCWLAGRSGAVFLSKDGVLFERVSAPDPGDLKSVQAVDALNATVTTEDDRTFTTSDGGVTWVRK